ncbi:MAG: hypothetical protein IJ173_07745 [Kiritimatiellae bacterium]|nr:hypothetical protein [Kiritimatiellia bacterium]
MRTQILRGLVSGLRNTAVKWAACLLATVCISSAWGATTQVTTATFEALKAAVDAADTGDIIEVAAAGTYTIPASGMSILKNITIRGAVDGVVLDYSTVDVPNHTSDSFGLVPHGVTFSNITFNMGGMNSGDSTGYPYRAWQKANPSDGAMVFKNCSFSGLFSIYKASTIFEDCTFTQTANYYFMWIYDISTVSYIRCTFNYISKCIHMYNEGGEVSWNVYAKDCTFNPKDATSTDNKGALYVKNDNVQSVSLILDSCSTTDEAKDLIELKESGKSNTSYAVGSDIVLNDAGQIVSGSFTKLYTGSANTLIASSSTITENGNGTYTVAADPYAAYVKVADGFYQNAATYAASTDFYITNLNGLKYFRDIVNGAEIASTNYVSRFVSVGNETGAAVASWHQGNVFSGMTVHLMVDIDLNNEQWTPIGYSQGNATVLGTSVTKNTFYGTFDAGIYDGGNNLIGTHTVSNLYVYTDSTTTKGYIAGFFGRIQGSAAIKNLTIENVNIHAYDYIGAVVGQPGTGGNVIVENCHVNGTINISGYRFMGGIAGHGYCTITNCTMGGNGTVASSAQCVGAMIGYLGSGSISDCTVSNVTISTGTFRIGAIAGDVGGGSTINGCVVSNATVTAANASTAYSGVVAGYLNSAAMTVLADNKVYDTTATAAGAAVTAQLGSANRADYAIIGADVSFDESGKVTGGIFENLPASAIASGYITTDNPDTDTNASYPLTIGGPYVAIVLDENGALKQGYATLAAAIEAAAAGDTVTLIADISDLSTVTVNAGQNVALDLNGHTIEAGLKQAGRHYYAIDNYGTFTLKDSSESQTGKIRARGIENLGNGVMIVDGGIIEAIDTNGGAAIWNEGTLTMNGGVLRVTHVGSSSDTYGPGALNNQGTATITKADIQSANKRTYAIISSGAITINPAKDDDVIVAGAHGGLAVDSGTATVTGGRFSSTEYYGLYVSNDGTGTAAKAQVTVSGGEFTGNTQSVHIGSDVNTPVDSVIEISGGTFHGTIFAENKVTEDGGISVSGGSFENPVPEAYCATGYIPNAEQDSETGLYTVKTGSYVAQIGTTKYESLADAIAAVPTTGAETTITMIANEAIDIAGDALVIVASKNVVLDLNGFQVVGFCGTGENSALILNNGTLTIVDSSDVNDDGTGAGKLAYSASPSWNWSGVDGDYSGSYASNLILNNGTVSVESGLLEVINPAGTVISASFAIDSAPGGVVNIKGGKLTSACCTMIRMRVDNSTQSALNISGGSVVAVSPAQRAILVQDSNKNGNSTVNISGGLVSGQQYSIQNESSGSNAKTTITGGTFNGFLFTNSELDISDGAFNGGYGGSTVYSVMAYGKKSHISGGVFYGFAVFYSTASSLDWSVTGGAFSYGGPYQFAAYTSEAFVRGGIYDDEQRYIAPGFVLTGNTDPATKDAYPYAVVPAVASITIDDETTYYATFEDAIDDAELSDEEVTITVINYNETMVAPEGWKFVTENDVTTLVRKVYVAQIGTIKYATLADAIAAVPADGTETTIQMIADSIEAAETAMTIASTQNVVIDLAGHTVSGTFAESKTAERDFIKNHGTLTVKDSSAAGTGKITMTTADSDNSYGRQNVTIYNEGGTFTLEGGCIENLSGYCAYAIVNSSNSWDQYIVSTFNMTGGSVSCPNGDQALRVYQNCAATQNENYTCQNYVNISGGTIVDTGIWLDGFLYTTGWDLASYTGENIKTVVDISGGTINGLFDYSVRHPYNTEVKISGGTFTECRIRVRTDYTDGLEDDASPAFAISGGKFAFAANGGLTLGSGTAHHNVPYLLTGGYYTSEPAAGYVASGYLCTTVPVANGYYQVVPAATVTFALGEGAPAGAAAPEALTYPSGNPAEAALPKPTYTSTVKTFAGWKVNGEGDAVSALPAGTEGDIAFTATWVGAQKVTITESAKTAEITVTDAWIADKVEIGSDATEEEKADAIRDALAQTDSNGLKKWENYVLGQEPTAKLSANALQGSIEAMPVKSSAQTPVVDTGFKVQYRLDKVTAAGATEATGTAQDSTVIPLDLSGMDGAVAYYKTTAVITATDGSSVSVEVPADNKIGVLKVASAPKTAMIAVPWAALDGDGAISAANLVRTANLTVGDELHYYKDGKFKSWTLNGNGEWEASTNVSDSSMTEGSDATAVTIPRGSAVWLKRQDASKPVYLVGEVGTGTAKTALEEGTENAPAWNMVASPSVEELDISEKFSSPNENDRIVVPTDGAPKNYTYQNEAWGYSTTEPVIINGVQVGVRPIRKTGDAKVPAGTGFWYLNSGAAKEVDWTSAEEGGAEEEGD